MTKCLTTRRRPIHAITAALAAAILGGCISTPAGEVRMDPRIFSRDTVIPLGTGIFGSILCNQLFKNHGSREGWTAACGIGGYLLGKNYTNHAHDVLEKNRVGQTSTWRDPDGYHVQMTPTNTWSDGERPCRNYRTVVEIDGKNEILTGTACREPDGHWQAQT